MGHHVGIDQQPGVGVVLLDLIDDAVGQLPVAFHQRRELQRVLRQRRVKRPEVGLQRLPLRLALRRSGGGRGLDLLEGLRHLRRRLLPGSGLVGLGAGPRGGQAVFAERDQHLLPGLVGRQRGPLHRHRGQFLVGGHADAPGGHHAEQRAEQGHQHEALAKGDAVQARGGTGHGGWGRAPLRAGESGGGVPAAFCGGPPLSPCDKFTPRRNWCKP